MHDLDHLEVIKAKGFKEGAHVLSAYSIKIFREVDLDEHTWGSR